MSANDVLDISVGYQSEQKKLDSVSPKICYSHLKVRQEFLLGCFGSEVN